jgi:hypothetical protein
VNVQGFKKRCICVELDGTDNDNCRMEVKRMGMLAVSVRKMKALTVKFDSTKDEDGESDVVKVDRCCILTL